LDPNRVTYEYHTRRKGSNFDTRNGLSITKGLKTLASKFDLSFSFGTAPQDYTLNQSPYPSNDSLLTLFIDEAVPTAIAVNNTRAHIPNLIIANSGSQRFDLYAGPFTKNDQFTVSPFTDGFLFIPNVTAAIANQVLPALNDAGANGRRSLQFLEAREAELYARGVVDSRYKRWLQEMDRRNAELRRATANLTVGYVTHDSCPGVGDDVLHTPLPFYEVPDFIGSNPPNVSDDSPIDLVFIDFIESQLLELLNSLQSGKVYTTADVQKYSPFLANQVLGVYAEMAWN